MLRRAAPATAAWAVATALAGCSLWPMHAPDRGLDTRDHMEFLVRALTAETAGRESMWQSALREPAGEVASLHRALLRSVPNHAGYDVAAAEAELQALLAKSPSADIAPVARARLEDLRAAAGCRYEVDDLKRRLSKVADIERRLNRERRDGKE